MKQFLISICCGAIPILLLGLACKLLPEKPFWAGFVFGVLACALFLFICFVIVSSIEADEF